MVRLNEIRTGETAVEAPPPTDAGLVFIGRIRTPWTSRLETPRQGRQDGPICRLEIFEPFVPAIKGVDFYENLEVIYWLDQSRRDLVLQSPKNNQKTRGTFSLRSPVRPNPIATSIVKLVGVEGNTILVRGMDCLDGTLAAFAGANRREQYTGSWRVDGDRYCRTLNGSVPNAQQICYSLVENGSRLQFYDADGLMRFDTRKQ